MTRHSEINRLNEDHRVQKNKTLNTFELKYANENITR